MSLIYWVGNIKTDAELVLPKHDILSRKDGLGNSISKRSWSGVEWRLLDLAVRDLMNDPHEFMAGFTSNDVSRWC